MKTLLLLLLIWILISGCQKELSGYAIKTCGIVTDKNAPSDHTFSLEVNYSGVIVREEVGLLQFSKINIGDKYCK